MKSNLIILLLLSLVCRGEELKKYRFEHPCMGTLFSIEVYAPNEKSVHPVIEQAWQLADELDGIFSHYKPESELCRLCSATEPVSVSPHLLLVLETSKDIHRKTNGAFDITLAPLQRLWRQSRRDHIMPKTEKVLSAREKTGMQHLILAGNRVHFTKPLSLDLGGIAKGYTADQLLLLLKSNGYHNALVAASGDLAIGDAPPETEGWRIGLVSLHSSQEPDLFLYLKNCGVSTSGDFEQYTLIGNQRFSHIMDPETGLGLVTRRCVSIIAPTATESDAFATALSVNGLNFPIASLQADLSVRMTELVGTKIQESRDGPKFKTP